MSNFQERALEYKSDPRPTAELLVLALSKDMDADNEDFWLPIRILQHRLPTEFPKIQELSCSTSPKDREVAATILGQNSVREKFDVQGCQSVLNQMLSQPDVISPSLESILFALGNLKASGYIDMILPFESHSNSDVRYAATHSLIGSDEESAISALIRLSGDTDFDVRNWATFGLGSRTELDSERIRAALVDRLAEIDEEIRGEALVGLVARYDVRAISPLRRDLDQWKRFPLVKECAETLSENKATFGPEWHSVFEDLERIGFNKWLGRSDKFKE